MFRSLKYRNFRYFFYGQFLSLIGSWIQQTAQAWLIYRMTKDPLLLGLVTFVGQFPVFLLGFYAGIQVDRLNHLRIVRWTQAAAMAQALVLAVLTLGGWIQVWHIFTLALLLGVVYAFDIPARQVLIGELVDEEHRPNAIALNSTIVNGARIVGPAVAGILIGWVGEGWCFALNAASYVSVLGALFLIKDARQAASQSSGSAWDEIGNGLAYAMGHDPIRLLLLLLTVFSIAGLPLFVLLPVFAEDVLHSGALGLGLLSSAAGLGATCGALLLARRRSSAGLGEVINRSLILYALAMTGLAFSRTFELSCAMQWLIGFSAIQVLAGTNMLLQEFSNDRYRGRIMGFYSMVFIGISPIGSFLVGGVASRIGVTATVCVQAFFCLAAGLMNLKKAPALLKSSGAKPPPADRPEVGL